MSKYNNMDCCFNCVKQFNDDLCNNYCSNNHCKGGCIPGGCDNFENKKEKI